MKTSSVDRLIMNSSGAITQGNTAATLQVGNYTIASNTGPSSSATNNWVAQFGNQTGATAVLLGWKSYSGRSFPVIGGQSLEPIQLQPDGGQVLKPSQSAFIAYMNTTSTANPVPFNATSTNINNNYNTSTFTYTAPESGMYFFNLIFAWDGSGNTSGYVPLEVNGTRYRDMFEAIPAVTTNTELHHSCIAQLTKNDTVKIVNPNVINFQAGGNENFYSQVSGYFLG